MALRHRACPPRPAYLGKWSKHLPCKPGVSEALGSIPIHPNSSLGPLSFPSAPGVPEAPSPMVSELWSSLPSRQQWEGKKN